MHLEKLVVGEFQTNCYLIQSTNEPMVVLVDPGAEAQRILERIGDRRVEVILITHGHHDHVGALQSIRSATRSPVGIHQADADHFQLTADFAVEDGDRLQYGDIKLGAFHVPGHTPGSIALLAASEVAPVQAIVGDAIFPGGPGHTDKPEDLLVLLEALERTVFTWGDATQLHPGHGPSTTVGDEQGAFIAFRDRDHPSTLCGDVTWS